MMQTSHLDMNVEFARLMGNGQGNFVHQSTSSILMPSSADRWRLSTANAQYSICESYPSLIIVPTAVSDDMIKVVREIS